MHNVINRQKNFESAFFTSNVNEVIRAVLNFFARRFHNHKKAQNTYKRTKTKKLAFFMCLKNI